MISSDRLTSDDARKAFADNLTYAQVTKNDIRALEGFLAIEYARHERMGGSMKMHPCHRKVYQPKINVSSTGGIESAYLRVSGSYFSGREAVSFNEDGFIGFAGWADDFNMQPFLRAFILWVKEWMGGKNVRRYCRAENLRAMCAPCHLRYDAANHAEARRSRRSAENSKSGTDTREKL